MTKVIDVDKVKAIQESFGTEKLDPNDFCWDKYCPLYRGIGTTHIKGIKWCKYEKKY